MQCYRVDLGTMAVDPGYPKPMGVEFLDVYDEMDAAYYESRNDSVRAFIKSCTHTHTHDPQVYFFKGNKYLRYSWETGRAAGNWHTITP